MPDGLQDTVSPHELVATQEEADQKNAEYNSQPFSRMFREEGSAPQIRFLTQDEVDRRMREYNAVNWYDWSIQNWGTKWGAYSHTHYELRWFESHDGDAYGRIDLRFETAWSQPVPIFKEIEREWNLKVHAVTQDEGGFPDTEYGDPYDSEVLAKVVTFEFQSWDTEVEEPEAAK